MLIEFFSIYFMCHKSIRTSHIQNGQIQYDDSLTETPIGTVIYAIDEVNINSRPSNSLRSINYQLQDVVTHGNFNDRIRSQNLFTIGDRNDANVDDDSEEDDDDVIDVDGGGGVGGGGGGRIVDKQPNKSAKFANFALNADKPMERRNKTHAYSRTMTAMKAGASARDSGSNRGNHMIQRQNQSVALINNQRNNENAERNQGQPKFEDSFMATISPIGQMTYKPTSKSRVLYTAFCLCHVLYASTYRWKRKWHGPNTTDVYTVYAFTI